MRSGVPGPAPARPGQVAAFFDVDNTIVRGASAYHLARELYRRGFFGMRDILFFARHSALYLLLGEDVRRIDKVRERALRIIRGHPVAEIISIGEDVYDEVLDLRIFPGTRALLRAHLRAGHQVWLVTATPTEISDLIARRLGATGSLGTRAGNRDGYYTGELDGTMLHGAGKERAVRLLAEQEDIDLSRSFAYGDSINDVPILSSVGHPAAINPEPRLRLHAMQEDWPIRDFRRRRRSVRVGVRRGMLGAGSAGAVWAATAVVRAMRRQVEERFLGQ